MTKAAADPAGATDMLEDRRRVADQARDVRVEIGEQGGEWRSPPADGCA